MKRRNKQERRELVEAYRRSGLTQEAFAARRGINVGTLRGWLYRDEPAKKAAATARFVEVAAHVIAGPEHAGRIVLRIGGHLVLELEAMPEPEFLARLARALGC